MIARTLDHHTSNARGGERGGKTLDRLGLWFGGPKMLFQVNDYTRNRETSPNQ